LESDGMNVLVITQYFRPESFRINEVVESLQRTGCRISVLTGQPNYPDGRIYAGYRAWGVGRNLRDSGVPVHRVPVIARGAGGAWRLAANYLSFVVSASLLGPWLLRGQRFDVILVYGMSPILQAVPGVVLKRLKRAALITWVQDLWPQSLEVTGFVHNRWLLNRVASVVRWIYRHNNLLLVQSQAFVPIVQAMAGGVAVQYLPNPGELSFDQAFPPGSPAVTLKPGFNVVFAGNLGTVQALDTVLDAAALLLADTGINIVLLGSGSRADWLMQEVARRNLGNVQFPGRVPPEAMPGILAQASALLVTLVRDPTMSQTIPSKVQAYLAAGRPIIASLDGEGARVVEESGAGIVCSTGDSSALAQAVLRLRAMSEPDRERMGAAGRGYYRQHFDPSRLAQELVGFLAGATKNEQ
jgi:glycosyltransferase involved in cell wall biosynthesis